MVGSLYTEMTFQGMTIAHTATSTWSTLACRKECAWTEKRPITSSWKAPMAIEGISVGQTVQKAVDDFLAALTERIDAGGVVLAPAFSLESPRVCGSTRRLESEDGAADSDPHRRMANKIKRSRLQETHRVPASIHEGNVPRCSVHRHKGRRFEKQFDPEASATSRQQGTCRRGTPGLVA